MQVTLEIAALIGALAWPAVVGYFIWRHSESIGDFLRDAPRRVRSVSAAGIFSVELAQSDPQPVLAKGINVDLRHAGTSGDIDDSTLRGFYSQIEDPSRLTHAVVDLAEGRAWLSSRLFILSVILRRMRGVEAFVILSTVDNVPRQLLGICDALEMRWRLASHWPRYESALAAAEMLVWGHPYHDTDALRVPWQRAPGTSHIEIPPFRDWAHIENSEGRIVTRHWPSPEPAVELLKSFLDGAQRSEPLLSPPHEEWQLLATPSPGPVVEYAEWLTGPLLENVLGDSLDRRSIRIQDWQGWSDAIRGRAIVEHDGRWVPITRDERTFDRVIDRIQVLEHLGRSATSTS